MTETLDTLTVRELTTSLQLAGIDISYKTVSDFLLTDDISAQLGITGDRNARHIPASALPLLVAFFPQYRENKGRLPQAAAMLRTFRELLRSSQSEVLTSTAQLLPVERLTSTPPLGNIGQQIVTALQQIGVIAAPDDALLTLKTAQEVYGLSLPALRKLSILEGGRRKVKRSAVLKYIEGLK